MREDPNQPAVHEPVPTISTMRRGQQPGRAPDAVELIRRFNASNKAHLQLWRRVLQATDVVAASWRRVGAAEAAAAYAEAAYVAVQAEQPDRTAPRVRQLLLAAVALGLDGVACNMAAQTMGDSGPATWLWTVYFLAVLAGGEIALDLSRGRPLAWRLLAGCMAGYVLLLGAMRWWFLETVTAAGTGLALLGAAVFTVATASFVVVGYRALRSAETLAAWRARRVRNSREQAARRARLAAEHATADQDRLVCAYLGVMRSSLTELGSAAQVVAAEQAVLVHLTGQPVAVTS
jgi:hypothetical protein